MSDTAQPVMAADPESQLQNAANAFKALDAPDQPRDEAGRFASQEEEIQPEIDDGVIDEGDDGEIEVNEESKGDEPEDHQELTEMPSSWSNEDSEVWDGLPPEAQAKIAEREGQRDTAVNQKFQEAANIRKENEALIDEANANRDKFIKIAQEVEAVIQPQKPNPADYGAGTGNYNREAYDLAISQYEAQTDYLNQVRQHRENAEAERDQQAEKDFSQRKDRLQEQYGPKLVELVPDLKDSVKQAPAMFDLVKYAQDNGIDPETFAPENQKYVTAAELTILAKAKAYDRLTANKGKPAPKKAGPAIKPGVTSPRSTVKKTAFKKKAERLAKTGSIEDGAAIFKDFL